MKYIKYLIITISICYLTVGYAAILVGLYVELSNGSLSETVLSPLLTINIKDLFLGMGYSLMLCGPIFGFIRTLIKFLKVRNYQISKLMEIISSDAFSLSTFITIWLAFSFSEAIFSLLISVVSFLALLMPLFSDTEE